MHETDSFQAVETLIRRNAPLMMIVGDSLRPEPAPRRRVHCRTIARMKHLRMDGQTIGDIARACRVSWRTAWLHSKPAWASRKAT